MALRYSFCRAAPNQASRYKQEVLMGRHIPLIVKSSIIWFVLEPRTNGHFLCFNITIIFFHKIVLPWTVAKDFSSLTAFNCYIQDLINFTYCRVCMVRNTAHFKWIVLWIRMCLMNARLPTEVSTEDNSWGSSPLLYFLLWCAKWKQRIALLGDVMMWGRSGTVEKFRCIIWYYPKVCLLIDAC